MADEEKYGDEDRAKMIKKQLITSNESANFKIDLLVENCPEIRGQLNERMRN
jgi:hypothetical protein